MRSLPGGVAVAVAALAACSNPRAGLYVQLTGGSAGSAGSIEVIAADPGVMIDQRTSDVIGSDTATNKVPYYVQRATTGEITGPIDLSHYTVLVETDPALDLTSVVPIVVARDGSHVVTAIGVLEDDTAATDAAPANAVTIKANEAQIVQITMLPRDVSGSQVAGAVTTLRCPQPVSDSGYDWYDSNGRELRIVLPGNDGSADARPRGLDLDCDGSPAPQDCDDLVASIHPNAAVGCNGLDNDCTMTAEQRVDTCTTGSGCTDGRQLCDESSQVESTCASPTCDNLATEDCLAPFASDAGDNTLCPTIAGPIDTPSACGNGCELEITDVSPGIDAGLSTDGTTYTPSVLVPPAGKVMMSVDALNGAGSDGSVGTVEILVVAVGGSASYYTVGIRATTDIACTAGTSAAPDLLCTPDATPGPVQP